jgi:hypothetical protein
MIRSRTYLGQLTRRLGGQEFTFALPQIVPDDLWHLANAQIDGSRRTARRHAKHDYLLSSSKEEPFLRCLVCHQEGKEYMMGGRTNYKPGPGRAWLHYRCYGRGGHTVSAKQIETAVWEALVGMLTQPSLVLENIAKLADAASKQYQDLQAELAGLSERAALVRAAQMRLAEATAWGKLPADILQAQADALDEEAQEIAGQISLAHVQIAQARAETVPIRDIEEACALLAEGAAGATFSERQWIVRTLVERVYADKKEWVLEGRLPTLRARGSLPGATIAEQRS